MKPLAMAATTIIVNRIFESFFSFSFHWLSSETDVDIVLNVVSENIVEVSPEVSSKFGHGFDAIGDENPVGQLSHDVFPIVFLYVPAMHGRQNSPLG